MEFGIVGILLMVVDSLDDIIIFWPHRQLLIRN